MAHHADQQRHHPKAQGQVAYETQAEQAHEKHGIGAQGPLDDPVVVARGTGRNTRCVPGVCRVHLLVSSFATLFSTIS